MNARTALVATLATTLAASAVVLTGPGAHARPAYELIDRSAFDGAPTAIEGGWTMSADTRGEFGGHLTLTARASDGTLPGANECEPATASATLSLPGETWELTSTGEICDSFFGGSPSFFGDVTKKKDVTYSGPRKKGDFTSAFISTGGDWLGALGSVSLTLKA
jgi:hypothetical protein